MFLAGIWVLESTEHRVWSQALAEELCESIHLVQPRPVQGQLELCLQIGGNFNCPVPHFPQCWIARLCLLSLDEKHQRSWVKAEFFGKCAEQLVMCVLHCAPSVADSPADSAGLRSHLLWDSTYCRGV